MKHLLPFGFALLATAVMAKPSEIESQELTGIEISSISDNGQWVVGDLGEGSLRILKLATGEKWDYVWDGSDESITYTTSSNRCVSDNGIVAGEVWNIPSYWENGKWTNLKGWIRDNQGYVAAYVGAITPDGSMIVGGLGKGGSMYDEGDSQMTYPCIWYRQDDGTYGDPVFLPGPEKDLFGRVPQYLHCHAVSTDGKTIAAMMRTGSGYTNIPCAFTLGEDGEWTYVELGMQIINPKNIELYPYPGDYEGSNVLDYEKYMTEAQMAQWEDQYDRWYNEQLKAGYSEEMIETYLACRDVMEFMSGTKLLEYQKLFKEYDETYGKWLIELEKYNKSLDELLLTGQDFEFNNIFMSPDGKYVYSSAKPAATDIFTPVRLEVTTGQDLMYPNSYKILVSSITADYSVLGRAYDPDDAMPVMGYIFPQGEPTPISIVDFFSSQLNLEPYDWMEEFMYRQVVASLTASGDEVLDDKWCIGKPVATPDMSLIGFANVTAYWEPEPKYPYTTFLLNTGFDVEGSGTDGIDEVATPQGASIGIINGGRISISGEVASMVVYDLSGKTVYAASNPSGVVATGLPAGVYVVRAEATNGEVITEKAAF